MTETISFIIPVSPEQEEVIALHFLKGTELGMVPDERAWMLGKARASYPGCKIVSADLDPDHGDWTLTLEIPSKAPRLDTE